VSISAALLLLSLSAPAPQAPKPDTGWTRPEPSSLRRLFGLRFTAHLGDFELLAINQEEWTVPYISRDGARAFVATGRGQLEARDLASGDVLWRKTQLGAIGQSMGEHRGELLVGVLSALVAFDEADGSEKWRLELGGHIGGDLTVTGTTALIPVRPNSMVLVDLVARQEVWRVKRPTPEGMTMRGQSAATVDRARDRAFFGFSDGHLVAVSLATGTQRWAINLGVPREFFPDVDTAPVLVDDGAALLAASYNGGLFKIDTETGRTLWKKDERGIDGLALAGSSLLVATHGEGRVSGLSSRDGTVRWQYKLDRGWPTQPVPLGHGLVAVGASQGAISVLDAQTGRPIQLIKPGSGVSAHPFFRDPDLVLLSNRGLLMALRLGASP
jgi:outer membrane protein assembly factor BamB